MKRSTRTLWDVERDIDAVSEEMDINGEFFASASNLREVWEAIGNQWALEDLMADLLAEQGTLNLQMGL